MTTRPSSILLAILILTAITTTASAATPPPSTLVRSHAALRIATTLLPDDSILHAIRIHGWNEIGQPSVCVLSIAGWTGHRWSLQRRLRVAEGAAFVRLKRVQAEEEELISSEEQLQRPHTTAATQIARRGGDSELPWRSRTAARWLLQLQCIAIGSGEADPERILQAHPRNGIVAQVWSTQVQQPSCDAR